MTPLDPRTSWRFASAGEVVFGWGASQQLPPLVQRWSPRTVLVVSDPALEQAGIVDKVVSRLQAACSRVVVTLESRPEPTVSVAEQVLQIARESQPDVIVAVGGGSNMDVAKVVAAVMRHGGMFRDYFGFGKIPGPVLPLVCLPTTAGTGSEVSHSAVLTDEAARIKVSTLSPFLRPAVALVDPELTLSCPRQPTADSGIDALTHAIEAFTATHYRDLPGPDAVPFPYAGKQPLADICALRAIELVREHLVSAVHEPSSRSAREGMSLAALLGGLAFSNAGVAVVHALEYPLGGLVHVSHGAGNGLLLPYVMRFNLPTRERELAEIGRRWGVDSTGVSDRQVAERGIEAIAQLRRQIGIPEQLRELGVERGALPDLARQSFGIERLMLLNGRRPTEADLLAILEEAF